MAESVVVTIEERGRQQGRQQGIVEAKQDDVLRVLRCRFHELPSSVEDRVKDTRDIAQLDVLLEEAVVVRSPEDLSLE